MKNISFIEAITEAMAEEMRRDDRVIVMGEDVAVYGGVFKATKGLLDEFGPQRVIDTPISEEFIVGGAVGAAALACAQSPKSSSPILPLVDLIRLSSKRPSFGIVRGEDGPVPS